MTLPEYLHVVVDGEQPGHGVPADEECKVLMVPGPEAGHRPLLGCPAVALLLQPHQLPLVHLYTPNTEPVIIEDWLQAPPWDP